MPYLPIDIESSYRENDLGRTIYDTVMRLKPVRIVEFGCLYGYSTVAMAMALRDLNGGVIFSYDLWDDYEYKKPTFINTSNNIKKYGLEDYVVLLKADLKDWLKKPGDFDLLHIDVSNTGTIMKEVYDALKYKAGSSIIFEGGSEERDQVEWMHKYNKRPMNDVKDYIGYEVINEDFPSISIINL